MCGEIQERLTEDLGHRFEEPIASHLDSCPQCRSLCNDLIKLEELSKSLSSSQEIPFDYRAELHSRISADRGLTLGKVLRLGFAASVLLLISTAAVALWDGSSAEPATGFSVQALPPVVEEPPVVELPALTGSPYVDVILEDTPNGEMRLRLPSVIEVRQNEVQEEFYLQYVSH